MANLSYWEKDELLKSYDLIVVGAGIVGLSSVIYFKKENPKANVLVVERGYFPSGASTKNAGFACIGSPTEVLSDLTKATEDEVVSRIQLRYKGLNRLRQECGDQYINYDACGGYEIFDNNREFENVADHLSYLNELYEEATGEKNTLEQTVYQNYASVFNRLEGAIHTGKMMHRWIQKAQELDIELRFSTEVKAIKSNSVLLSSGLVLNTNKILVTVNGFIQQLADIDVEPGRGLVLISKPIENLKWKGTFHYDEGFIYFRNVENRLLLGGARNLDKEEETIHHFGINQLLKKHLLEFSSNTLDVDLNSNLDMEWSGIMGFTETKSPFMYTDENIAYCVGLGGMGVAIGSELGYQMAAQLS